MTPAAAWNAAIDRLHAPDAPVYSRRLIALLEDARLRTSDDTPTARVRRSGDTVVISLGRAFCETHLLHDDDAVLVVAHEAMHAIQGHLGLPPGRTPVERQLRNIALDILVNGAVLRLFLPGGCDLFGRLYAADRYPDVLLCPPTTLLVARAATDPAARSLAGRAITDLAEAWADRGPDAARLERLVSDHFRRLDVRRPDAVARCWLGGWLTHVDARAFWTDLSRLLGWDERIAEAELSFLGDHDGPPDGIAGHGHGRGGPAAVTEVGSEEQAARAFVALVQQAVDRAPGARTRAVVDEPERTVVPRPGRRELVMLASGHSPAFYTHRDPRETVEALGVHLYLDVSGSTAHLQPLFLGLAQALGEQLARPAWAFSTEVHPIAFTDLARGRVRTTGGTDLACVVDHALGRRFRRIAVVTDGDVPSDRTKWAEARAGGLHAVFLLTADIGPRERRELEAWGECVDVPAHWRDELPF